MEDVAEIVQWVQYYKKTDDAAGFHLYYVLNYYPMSDYRYVFQIRDYRWINKIHLTYIFFDKINLERILCEKALLFTLYLQDFLDFVFRYIDFNCQKFFVNVLRKTNFYDSKIYKFYNDNFTNNKYLSKSEKLSAELDLLLKKYLDLDLIYFKSHVHLRNTHDIFKSSLKFDALSQSTVIGGFFLMVTFIFVVLEYLLVYLFLVMILFRIKEQLKNNNNYLIQKAINFVEYNTSNFSDVRVFLVTFSCFFMSFFCYSQYFLFIDLRSWMMYTVTFFIFFSISIPIFFILAYGVFFLVFIGGVDKKSSYVKQLSNNIISFVAFILRFVLQNMRIILIMAYGWVFTINCYEELNEFIYESQELTTMLVILIFLKNVFEIIDVLMIFCVQLFAFLTVLTCLFSFVLVIEERFNYESFFAEKRKEEE